VPAVSPIQDQKLEAECVNLDRWLKTYTQVVVVHLVEFRTRMQKADMAGDCKEQIVVEGRQLGQLVLQQLGCGLCAHAFSLNLGLDLFWKYFVRQLSQPPFE
jgi:hypothetical protein